MYKKLLNKVFGNMPKNVILVVCIFFLGAIIASIYALNQISGGQESVVGGSVDTNIFRIIFFSVLLWLGIDAYKLRRYLEGPNPDTHVRCPDCRELVRKEATKCKHCGCTLIPQ
jgi:hypothetical protein